MLKELGKKVFECLTKTLPIEFILGKTCSVNFKQPIHAKVA